MTAADEVPLTPPPGTVTTAPVPDSIPLLPSPVGGGTGNDRFARGLARLTAIHGDHGLGVMKSLEPICPDLARFIIEYPFGDIYSRPGLDPKSRQIATMASLVTLGHATSELKSHIRGSLNIGLTRTEIIELILQMSVYAGFPASINAMRAAQEVFEQLDNGRG
ncbi:carboxymuconolactone decarboxylase family protein [bacterium]|nr:carboxymuconolactone decarboxylase family protein [bacterium]